MSPELDRLNLLDEAVRQHYVQHYSEIVKNQHGEDAPIYFASSMRAFSEMHTRDAATKNPNPLTKAEIADTRRLPIPRISIMRQTVAPDPNRQYFAKPIMLRYVAYHDPTHRTIYQSPGPIPINIAYQVDFWTRKMTEMNRWIIQFHDDFRMQLKYLTVHVDDFFRNKYMGLFLTGGPDDTSDLEPGEDRTLIRQTATFEGQSWIWPTASQLESKATVKEIIACLETERGEDLGCLNTNCVGG